VAAHLGRKPVFGEHGRQAQLTFCPARERILPNDVVDAEIVVRMVAEVVDLFPGHGSSEG